MKNQKRRDQIIEILNDPRIGYYSSEVIVEKLSQTSLKIIQQMMVQYPALKVTQFLRFFLCLLQPSPQEETLLTYGLFRVFKDLCRTGKCTEINFSHISKLVTERLPFANQEKGLSQKILPLMLDLPEQIKDKITSPTIEGKVIQQRIRLNQNFSRYDKRHHLHRRIGQGVQSIKNQLFFTIDSPSSEINILNMKLEDVSILKTELQLSKRDSVITSIAWSETEQRIACLLGNFSISMWAKDDDFRFEVNVPLLDKYLTNPFIALGYMESSKKWYAYDNRPVFYVLSSYNFEPQYSFKHSKISKKKETQKILTVELKYRKILCVAYERVINLISLDKRQLVNQIPNLSTSVTSVAFLDSFQALFVSTYDTYFRSYQLSEFLDLTEKGKFEGHKNVISLLGVLENKPIVFSLQQSSIMKMWDIRDFTCYQTFSVLKNILYHQVLTNHNGICLIGSKMYLYDWTLQPTYIEPTKTLLLEVVGKEILLVTTKQLYLHDSLSGKVVKLIKGVFGNIDISIAFFIEQRNRLLICDDQGNMIIYDTGDFTIVRKSKIQSRPSYFQFDNELDLLTYCCQGNTYVSEYLSDQQIAPRRKIINKQLFVKKAEVSAEHDLICLYYEGDSNLYFYSYEKAKTLGYMIIPQFVQIILIQGYPLAIILQKKQLSIISYNKTISAITFFSLYTLPLWRKEDLQQYNLQEEKLQSFQMVLLSDQLVIISNSASIYQVLRFTPSIFKTEHLTKQKQNYNPYRVSMEDHNQMFLNTHQSVTIKQLIKSKLQYNLIYQKLRGEAQICGKIYDFFFVGDSKSDIFIIQLPQNTVGCLNINSTLPKLWQVHHYSEKDLKQMQFVIQFLQNERSYLTDIVPNSYKRKKEKQQDNLTITSLLKEDKKRTQPLRKYKSCSLRQKKMVLEKYREQKEKDQDFQQHKKAEEQLKSKTDSRKLSQKQITDAVNYFNVNYSDILLKKGMYQDLHPDVRKFQKKIDHTLFKDEKKSVVSMISKVSGGIYSNSKSSPNKLFNNSNVITKVKSIIDMIKEDKRQYTDPKVLLKKLNVDLKQSKKKGRQDSLPSLRKHGQEIN